MGTIPHFVLIGLGVINGFINNCNWADLNFMKKQENILSQTCLLGKKVRNLHP